MFGLIKKSKLSEEFEKARISQEEKDRMYYEEKMTEMQAQFEFDKQVLIATKNAEISRLESKISDLKTEVKQAQKVYQWCRSQTQSNSIISSELASAVGDIQLQMTDLMRQFNGIEDRAIKYSEEMLKLESDHKKQLNLLKEK